MLSRILVTTVFLACAVSANAWAEDKPNTHQMTRCTPGKEVLCGINDHMGQMEQRLGELHAMTRRCMKEDAACDMDKMMVAMRDMHGRMEKMMNDMEKMHQHPQAQKQ